METKYLGCGRVEVTHGIGHLVLTQGEADKLPAAVQREITNGTNLSAGFAQTYDWEETQDRPSKSTTKIMYAIRIKDIPAYWKQKIKGGLNNNFFVYDFYSSDPNNIIVAYFDTPDDLYSGCVTMYDWAESINTGKIWVI